MNPQTVATEPDADSCKENAGDLYRSLAAVIDIVRLQSGRIHETADFRVDDVVLGKAEAVLGRCRQTPKTEAAMEQAETEAKGDPEGREGMFGNKLPDDEKSKARGNVSHDKTPAAAPQPVDKGPNIDTARGLDGSEGKDMHGGQGALLPSPEDAVSQRLAREASLKK